MNHFVVAAAGLVAPARYPDRQKLCVMSEAEEERKHVAEGGWSKHWNAARPAAVFGNQAVEGEWHKQFSGPVAAA